MESTVKKQKETNAYHRSAPSSIYMVQDPAQGMVLPTVVHSSTPTNPVKIIP